MAKRHDLMRLVAARFISKAGSEAAFFIGVWGKAAYGMHATPAELAMLMTSLTVAAILGSGVGGVLIDRHGPRKVLVVSELLFVPSALAVFFAKDIGVLIALTFVWAFVGAPVPASGASFAPFLADQRTPLSRINSWVEGAGSAAFVTGPAVGAIVARYSSPDWVFVIDAVTSVIAAVLVFGIRVRMPKRAEGAAERHPLAEFREGLAAVYRMRGVRYYVLAGTVLWLSFGAFGALEPLFFRDVVGTGVETIGWVNVLFGGGLIVGAALLPRLPVGIVSARGLLALVVLNGFGALAYVGSTDLRVIGAGAIAWGLVIGLLEPLIRTLTHRDTPEGLVGRVIGTSEVHRRVGELVPLGLAPALAATFGVQGTLIVGGLGASALALLSLPEALAIDRGRPAGPLPTREESVAYDEPRSLL